MILSQILHADCVKVPIKSKTKEEAITELIDLLAANHLLKNPDASLEAVLARERMQSTGTGAGIAIPHAKCSTINEIVMAIGIASEPIEFDSIDGKPVSIIILLISPLNQTGLHIQALAKIGGLMLNKEFKTKLENAASADEVYDLLSNEENQ